MTQHFAAGKVHSSACWHAAARLSIPTRGARSPSRDPITLPPGRGARPHLPGQPQLERVCAAPALDGLVPQVLPRAGATTSHRFGMLRSTQRTATASSCTLQPHACTPVADKHYTPAESGNQPSTVCRGWRAPCLRAACPAGTGSPHCCCWSAAAGPRAASGTRCTAAAGPAHRHTEARLASPAKQR